MKEYDKIINRSQGKFTENDVIIALDLLEARRSMAEYINNAALSSSDRFYDDKLYEKYGTTQEAFWDKVRIFDKQTWALFEQAIRAYLEFRGLD